MLRVLTYLLVDCNLIVKDWLLCFLPSPLFFPISQFPISRWYCHPWLEFWYFENWPSFPSILTLIHCVAVTCTYTHLMESHYMSCQSLYQKTRGFLSMRMMTFAAYVKMGGIFCVVMDAHGLFTKVNWHLF